jgi:hypothetical protein
LGEESLHTSLKVHFNAIAEDLHQQFEDIFEQNGGVVAEKIKDGRSVLGEYVWDVGGVLLADGPDHGDALVAGGPVALYVAVELAEELLVEGWRGRKVVIFVDGGVWLVVLLLHD